MCCPKCQSRMMPIMGNRHVQVGHRCLMCGTYQYCETAVDMVYEDRINRQIERSIRLEEIHGHVFWIGTRPQDATCAPKTKKAIAKPCKLCGQPTARRTGVCGEHFIMEVI